MANISEKHATIFLRIFTSWCGDLDKPPVVQLQLLKNFPKFYGNQKVHYCVHKSPPLVSVLSQINPVHTTPFYLSPSILLLSTHPRLGLSSGLSFWLPHQYPVCIPLLPIYATCPAHLILLDLIILIILVKEYKL
jgi:hypothetical protein